MPLKEKSSPLRLSVGEPINIDSKAVSVTIVYTQLTGRGILTTLSHWVGFTALPLIKTSASAVATVTTIRVFNIQQRGYSRNFALA